MLNTMNKKKKRKGFTLVELVVVIAILGILATIAIPRFSSSRRSAEIAAHNANVRVIKSVAVMYLADNPGVSEISMELLKDRFDGDKIPETALDEKGEKVEKAPFEVDLDGDGDIVVTPGLIGETED